MKFLIDAQLPRRLALQLRDDGFEATHTLDLPQGNRTKDQVLVTCDDFFPLRQRCSFISEFNSVWEDI
jgi:predicted nuclease of predicted toxin-antitoxin system